MPTKARQLVLILAMTIILIVWFVGVCTSTRYNDHNSSYVVIFELFLLLPNLRAISDHFTAHCSTTWTGIILQSAKYSSIFTTFSQNHLSIPHTDERHSLIGSYAEVLDQWDRLFQNAFPDVMKIETLHKIDILTIFTGKNA